MQATRAEAKLKGNVNKFKGTCENCGTHVAAEAGRCWQRDADDDPTKTDGPRFVVWCCGCLEISDDTPFLLDNRPGEIADCTVDRPEGGGGMILTDRKVGDGGSVGDFVLSGQEQTDKFRHVSKPWQEQCKSFEQGLQQAATDAAQVQDIRGPLCNWVPQVSANGQFEMQYRGSGALDGATFKPTPWATRGMLTWANLHPATAGIMEDTTKDAKGETKMVVKRGRADVQRFVDVLKANLFDADRVEQHKRDWLFRTRKDGTMRAMLSDQYAVVDNSWYLQVLAKAVPGGLISHFRGDGDTMRFNVLVPDTIRSNPDSDYGGGVAAGNSEIGQSKIYSHPFSFRAICMNGCIWDAESGTMVSRVHRGRIDLGEWADEIVKSIHAQIDIAAQHVDRWTQLDKRTIDAPMHNVWAALQAVKVKGVQLSNADLRAIDKAWNVEPESNARGVVNAVTREAQTGNKADRAYNFDRLGGRLMMFGDSEWSQLLTVAKGIEDKALAKIWVPSTAA